jgi:hypothetical protein
LRHTHTQDVSFRTGRGWVGRGREAKAPTHNSPDPRPADRLPFQWNPQRMQRFNFLGRKRALAYPDSEPSRRRVFIGPLLPRPRRFICPDGERSAFQPCSVSRLTAPKGMGVDRRRPRLFCKKPASARSRSHRHNSCFTRPDPTARIASPSKTSLEEKRKRRPGHAPSHAGRLCAFHCVNHGDDGNAACQYRPANCSEFVLSSCRTGSGGRFPSFKVRRLATRSFEGGSPVSRRISAISRPGHPDGKSQAPVVKQNLIHFFGSPQRRGGRRRGARGRPAKKCRPTSVPRPPRLPRREKPIGSKHSSLLQACRERNLPFFNASTQEPGSPPASRLGGRSTAQRTEPRLVANKKHAPFLDPCSLEFRPLAVLPGIAVAQLSVGSQCPGARGGRKIYRTRTPPECRGFRRARRAKAPQAHLTWKETPPLGSGGACAADRQRSPP